MKKITLSLFFALAFSNVSNAQLGSGWDWASVSTVATYSPGRHIIDLDTDSQGNVYGVGRFMGSMTLGAHTISTLGDGSVNFNFDEDAFLVKYNASGQVQWLKRFGTAAIASNQMGQVVCADASGNVYIGGSGMANATTNSSFLIKYDTNGNILWSRTDLPLYEINGVNIGPDGNPIVMESNGGVKNIYKMNAATGATIWTVTNTTGSNGASRYDDFVDANGNIYYTCFTSGAASVNIAGVPYTATGLTTFFASIDTNGVTRWMHPMPEAQVTLSYTIDRSNGKSYIQIAGGGGGDFQGYSTVFISGSRYFELNSAGNVIRNVMLSPYKGLFRVKNGIKYGFITEQGGAAGTVNYGGYSINVSAVNTEAFGVILRYNENDDQVSFGNSFKMTGAAWVSGTLKAIEPTAAKIIVGGYYGATAQFGTGIFSVASAVGNSPKDMFVAQLNNGVLDVDTQQKAIFSIFPNPATSVFNIASDAMINIQSIHIYDMLGQKIQTVKPEALENIDVSKLNTGTYIIEIISEKGREVKKIVKR